MQFSATAIFIASVFGAFVAAQPIDVGTTPACTTSDNAGFFADCMTALNGLSDTTPACSPASEPIFTRIENSALSCSVRTYSVGGTAECLNRSQVKAAALRIINACQFFGAGPNLRTEGVAEIAENSGNFVSIEWSACGGSCTSPL